MMPTALLLLLVGLVLVGVVSAGFARIQSLQNRLERLEHERRQDRELLEAVLLEDPAKVRRLMGPR